MRSSNLTTLVLLTVLSAGTALAASPKPAPQSKLPTGTTAVTYAVIPSKSFLDEKKKLFSLGLAVGIDWPKVPAEEKKRLVPLITKDVRIRNCISLSQNPTMLAYFKRTDAKMKISVVDAHGLPMLSTTMTLKNCPVPKKKQG